MNNSYSRLTLFIIIAVLVALASLIACTSTNGPTPTTDPTTMSSPTIKIISPAEDDTILAGSVEVVVEVTNFNITNKLGQPNIPGEGHIHYYLDVEPPITFGQPTTSSLDTFAATTETSYTWEHVDCGPHTFSVQLVNNDHTPLEPPVTATITITPIPYDCDYVLRDVMWSRPYIQTLT